MNPRLLAPREPALDWSARAHREVRERLELREEQLSKFAARSRDAQSRDNAELDDPMRTAYQRDRDRIVHSKAFRRLKHKTQVFVSPEGDHYRTRLTHTMEVMQVARSIARALNLNEDLAEAIALGHDLGHTPFGHAGEAALAEVLPGEFRHNEQSVRIVEALEKGGRGLNLTVEVRDGILKHSKSRKSIAEKAWGVASTLEGQIVKIADSLAYLNHDVDDALRAGVLSPREIPDHLKDAFGITSGERVTAFVTDVVDYNWRVATGEGDRWQDAVGNGDAIGLSPPVLALVDELRDLMFRLVYRSEAAKAADSKVRFVVHHLFHSFVEHPDEMPRDWAPLDGESVERRVADHISGMTDRYAMQVFHQVCLPREWVTLTET